MADNNRHKTDKNLGPKPSDSGSHDGLQNFIKDQYERQKDNCLPSDTQEIDGDRAANFLNRALKESERMNAEVLKSHAKLDALHAQVGGANIAAWRDEHAAEVLLPQQIEAVKMNSYSSPTDSA